MTEQQVHDPPAPPDEGAPERQSARRERGTASGNHPTALFPEHLGHPGPAPSRIRRLAREAVTLRRNQIPLGLFIVLSIIEIGLLIQAYQPPPEPPPDPFLAHFFVSSAQSGTSLFGNDRYLGEIGPAGREFTVLPGQFRLRVIHSYCRATETTVDFGPGEHRTIGRLDPICSHR
jgi:hypothetical protein